MLKEGYTYEEQVAKFKGLIPDKWTQLLFLPLEERLQKLEHEVKEYKAKQSETNTYKHPWSRTTL